MIQEGDRAPAFTLLDQDGQSVSLSSFRGSPIVLYFYPKDDTSSCAKEACDFRDALPRYEELGAKIVGVSPDPVKSHLKFATKYSLAFTLLADVERKVCEAYGVWKEKSMYGRKYMGVERSTFVIDRQGKIYMALRNIKVNGHVEAVLNGLQSMKPKRAARRADPGRPAG